MSTFLEFNKPMLTTLKDYYTYNTTPATLFETDDCIYIDGIPCDKYTLAPITFYKDKPLTSLNTIGTILAPFTTTRCFNRLFADQGRQAYRMPYASAQTLLKNNDRLSNGDEVIITPASVCIASTPTAARSNCALVISKSTNKITTGLHDDLGNSKSAICVLDDDRYMALRNSNPAGINPASYGRWDSTLSVFNRLTTSKSVVTVSNYGYIHSIIGTTLAGELIILATADTANTGTFTIYKLNKATLVVTVLLSTVMQSTAVPSVVVMEPAITFDNKSIYFPVMTTVVAAGNGVAGGKATYTINKYNVDIANGVVTKVVQTINLNGLATALTSSCNSGSSTNYASTGSNLVLTYLEVGGNKYLSVTNVINTASNVNNYSAAYPTYLALSGQYAMMYLFKIVGETLTLVDVKNLMGGVSDPPQAVFPVNNQNLLVARYNGLDILAIDTVANKFVTQNTVAEPIFACGVDELERIWYLTSSDALVNDARLKVFSVGALIMIKADFLNTDVTFTGSSFNNTLNVSVTSNVGVLTATSVQILIEGNAVFTSTGSKSINVTTSASGVVPIQVTITGDGMINLYSNFNIV